jgi:hypothetical protein
VGDLTIKQINSTTDSTTDQGLPPEGSLVKLVTAKLLDFSGGANCEVAKSQGQRYSQPKTLWK